MMGVIPRHERATCIFMIQVARSCGGIQHYVGPTSLYYYSCHTMELITTSDYGTVSIVQCWVHKLVDDIALGHQIVFEIVGLITLIPTDV